MQISLSGASGISHPPECQDNSCNRAHSARGMHTCPHGCIKAAQFAFVLAVPTMLSLPMSSSCPQPRGMCRPAVQEAGCRCRMLRGMPMSLGAITPALYSSGFLDGEPALGPPEEPPRLPWEPSHIAQATHAPTLGRPRKALACGDHTQGLSGPKRNTSGTPALYAPKLTPELTPDLHAPLARMHSTDQTNELTH